MKRTPLRKVSKKRLGELKVYYQLREEYLRENPVCERCLYVRATQIHHKKGRMKFLNDTTTWAGLCLGCHSWVEENKNEARKLGYILY